MEKTDKSRRLDEVALQWKTLPDTGHEAQKEALWLELFELFFELFDDAAGSESVLDMFERTTANYDPAAGPFSHYVRRSDTFRKHDEDLKRKKATIESVPLELPVGEDGSATLADLLPDTNAADPDRFFEMEGLYAELISNILHFGEIHYGKANNKTRLCWYRLFFTEDMTYSWKTEGVSYVNERDVFRAMLLDYLDYYMEELCRTRKEVCRSPLKPYGETVPGTADGNRETPLPIPADVSLAYLKRSGSSLGSTRAARSNNMKLYREMTNEILTNARNGK